ncbi:MAG: putative transposase [Cellvibrionaceae bacterium]|jgi:putative transposase
MTNHIHLLATPLAVNGISRMMQYLGRYYVRYFNQTYRRSGTLWEGRFKSCLVQDSEYFLYCQRYIELNPVRADMVKDPADYIWSSCRANALGITTKSHSPHATYLALGDNPRERQANYRQLFAMALDQHGIDRVNLNKPPKV